MIKKTLILLVLGFIPVTTYAALQANDDSLITGVSLPASLNVLANDTTDTGNALNISVVDNTSNQGGIITDNGNGILSYAPPTSFTGSDRFSYTINDGSGSEDTATVSIQVKPVTPYSGTLTQDTTWTADNVYLISGDVTVPLGVTLTINAGAVIKFQALSDDSSGGNDTARSELIITNGSLIAEGTPSEPIILTSNTGTPAAGDWGGIRHTGNGQLTLRYATIEYATLGVDYRVDGGFIVAPVIENSTIRDSTGRGLYLEGKGGVNLTASIINNVVHGHSSEGIYVAATETNTAITATVTNNHVYSNNRSGIYLESSSYSNSAFTALVNNNQVHDNYYYGIHTNSRSTTNDVQIVGNTVYSITNSSSWGIYVDNRGNSSRLEMVNNTVYGSQGGGLYLYNEYYSGTTTPLIQGNTLRDNSGVGLRVRNYRGTHTPLVKQNTVYNNGNHGIQFDYGYSDTFQPQVTLNDVHDNGGHGLSISTRQFATVVHNNIYNNTTSGIYLTNTGDVSRINFNNIYGNQGDYALHNNSSARVDARYNWWDAAPKLEMDAGNNPKNITRIFDIYDDGSKGTVDYRSWLNAQQTLSTIPVSWIKSPAQGENLKATTYRIEGSATAETRIDRIEVSTDGGTTWQVATGTLDWHYDWTVPGDGTYLIQSRVISTDGTTQTAAGNTVTIDSGLPTTAGVLTADETWTGTVNLTGDITVPAGVTLTIAAGTTVQFRALTDDTAGGNDPARSELLVNGALIAQGTASEPIVITSSSAGTPAAGDWGGIRQTGSGQLTLSHVTVEYTTLGVDYRVDGELTVSPTIENSTIRHSTGRGLYLEGKGGATFTASIQNNTIHGHNGKGIYLSATGTNTSVTVTVTNNQVYSNNDHGVYIEGSNYSNSAFTALVSNNQVHDNYYYGIYINSRSTTNDVQIVGNTVYNITNSSSWGISVNNSGNSPRLEMVNNTVYGGQGGGLYFYNYYTSGTVTPRIEDNTLRDNNGVGLRVHNYRGTHTPLVKQNTVYNNGGNGLQFDLYYSDYTFQPKISLNDVHDNGGHGLSISTRQFATVVHNNIYNNANNGIYLTNTGEVSRLNFNNIYGNNGDYALHNNSSALVDARYNWWDAAPTLEMDAGNNPKNITRLFDIYDNSSKGTIDYSQWLSAQQTLSTTTATSWVKAPADGETLKATTYQIEGSAVAPTRIERVEVSTDGGSTWHVATGTMHWFYDWAVPSDGSYLLQSRVVTTDGTIQTAAGGNTVTIDSNLATTSGVLAADETWTGTVNITGDITVPAGITLTIAAGTTINFQALNDDTAGGNDPSRTELLINGSLIAEGTVLEPIVLTSNASTPAAGDWGGIYQTDQTGNGQLTLRHVTVQYASLGVDYRVDGELTVSPTVENSIIRHSAGRGLYLEGKGGANLTVSLQNNAIHGHSEEGVYLTVSGANTAVTATVANNQVYSNSRYGIYLDGSSYSNAAAFTVLVNNNQVHDNHHHGIYINSRSTINDVQIVENTVYNITNSSSWGISVNNSGNSPRLEIVNNTVYGGQGGGLYFYNYYTSGTVTPQIAGNTLRDNNGIGLRVHNYRGTHTPLVKQNTVYNNSSHGIQFDYYYSDSFQPQITLNDVHDNSGHGLSISSQYATVVHNSIYNNTRNGIYLTNASEVSRINFNNIYGNTGDYALYNNSSALVDARYNWWDAAPKLEMDAGNNPKNITRLFDIYDDGGKGTVDYSHWLSAVQTLSTNAVSWLKAPADGETLKAASYRIEGAAIAPTGIDRIEVSADGGTTWHIATGTGHWFYDWTVPGDGTYLIKSRVITSEGTIQTAAGHTVTIDSGLATTSGVLAADETWTGTVNITGDITVPDGITLTVAAGTTVQFLALNDDTAGGNDPARAELLINGSLIAEGTADAPIAFTRSGASTPAAGDWGGIYQTGSGQLTLRYATVEYASLGVDYRVDGDFTVSPTIENSIIRHSTGRGLYLEGKGSANLTASIKNNAIHNHANHGVSLYATDINTSFNATVTNNQVYSNTNTGVYIKHDGWTDAVLTAIVTGNEIHTNNQYGLYISSPGGSNSAFTATVSNNQVHDIRYQGIYLNNRSATNNVQVAENTVYNITNSWGIEVSNSSDNSPSLELVKNTVSACQSGGVYLSNSSSSSGNRVFSLIEGNELHDNNGRGLYIYNSGGNHTPLVKQNTVYNNSSHGIQFDYYYSDSFQPQISLNDVHDNGGHGLSISTSQSATVVHNSIYNNTQNGFYLTGIGDVSRIHFNNLYGNNGDYALHNNGSGLVDARYNWWDTVPTQEMEAGNNPKNITRLFDIYDDGSKGTVDYSHWLSASQTLATDATSWITAPADGETLKAATYRIEGAATAPTDLERVEISTDGGTTWHVASGTLYWHYDWTVPGDGTYTIQARVVTADGSTQTTAASNSITIDNSIPHNAGILVADETWSGTVPLNGDIIIPEGVSLTLLPGTTVTFDRLLDSMHGGDDPNRIEIIVHGTLLSQGTAAEPVVMTSALPPKNRSDWGGIKVTGTLDLAYTTLEYGDYGVYCESKTSASRCEVQHSTIQLMGTDGVSVYAENNQVAQLNVSDSLIQQNGRYGIYAKAYQGTTQIQANLTGNEVFQNSDYGIYLEADGSSGDPEIQANLLNNQVHENPGYGVYIYTRSSAKSVVEVRDNQLYSTINGDGLYIHNYYAANTSAYTITGNEIYNNRNAGLRYYNQNAGISPVITHNNIHDNSDFGLHLNQTNNVGLIPTLSGNSIHHNGTGIFINATAATTIDNSELYTNSFDIRNQSSYAVNAQGNWWGIDTTNLLNTGSHPRNLSNLYDTFDDGNLGTVDYSAWLTNYATPSAPTLAQVSSPVAAATQTLTGGKEANSGIMLNGVEIVAVDAQTSWSVEITLQEGRNPLNLSAFNAEGLLSETITAQIVRDTQAPSLISSTPTNGALLNTQIETLDLVLHDDSTAIDLAQSVASASVTNSNNATITGTWTSQFNRLTFTAATPFADETYTVALTAIDTPLGNSATTSMTFTIDTGAPQAVTLAAVTSPTRTTPQVLSGTKEAGTAILINGIEVVALNDETSWQHSLALTEGVNDLAIVAQDAAHNNSAEVTASIMLDTEAPEVLAMTPANNTFTNQAPSTIDIALVDATSGIDEVLVQGNLALLGTVVAGSWGLNAAQHLIFTPDSALVAGAYTIAVEVPDLAGNVTTINSVFTYDATAPSLFTLDAVTSPTNNQTQTLSGDKEAGTAIWVNGSEALPANNDTSWNYIVTLASGTNTFNILARDQAGNQSDVITTTIVFDDLAPLPVAALTVNGAGNGNTAVLDWSSYDETAHGDIAGYWVFHDDSLFTQTATMVPTVKLAAGEQSYTITGLTKGQTYYFAVVALDVNNNLNTSVTPVTATIADVAPPEDVTALQAQSFADKLLLSWTHSANSGGDLSGYKVYQDTTLVGTLPATTNSFELTGLTAATAYPLTVTAFDSEGYESTGVSLTAVTLLPNPANLVATAAYQAITLTWDAVSPATLVGNYALYAAVNDFNSVVGMTPLQVLEPDVTTTTLSGLSNGTTYYLAVTAINQSGGQQTTVTTVSAIPEDDTAGPVVSEIQFDGAPLADGGTVAQPGTISLTANDAFGIGRVEFWVDGTLFHTDRNGSSHYSAFWQIMDVSDGTHSLEIKAYDTLGNSSSTVLTVSVALAPPAAPILTQPVTGLVTNQAQITVTGTAEPGTEVLLYRNGTEVGSPLSLDQNQTFSGPLTLLAGQNALQAAARNRTGTGPLSSSTQVTLDTNIPETPSGLRAEAREGGEIRLSWQASSDNDIVGYDLYRAVLSFNTAAQAQKVNTKTVTGTAFDDLVSTDGQYYYRVVAVNALGTASALSNEVSVKADATPPRATLIEYTPALSNYTQGRVEVALTVSEPLLTTPFLSFVPDAGVPISIELVQVTETQYQGHLDITGTTPSGTAYAVFSARDTAGNRGTEIDAGVSINIDSEGPFVTKLTLSPAEPIRNVQTHPVTVQVEIELNEALPTGKVPELSYRIGSASVSLPALTQTSPVGWSASFSLPANAGLNATEDLQFIFRAEDDLGNVGNQIQGHNRFQIYQDDLPPLAVPLGLVGIALPDGRVHLSWEAVTEATDYQLFRQAPGETELSPYQRSGGALTLTDETKPQDGLYRYAVASIRSANTQEAMSVYGNIVEAMTDSVAPIAPANFQLALVGAGIRATWEAPAGNEALTYLLYRAVDEIIAVTGLTAIKTGITELTVIDNAPSETEHYYAVVARDAVGNESPVSVSAYLNVDLLPVATLEAVQTGENPPVLSWSHAATNLTGFDIYLGAETERVKVNATPLQNTTYTDSGYNRQERVYTVVTIDSNGVESLGRTLVLPELTVEWQNTTPIRRGQFNTLNYRVTNQSNHPVTPLSLTAQLGDYAVHSQPFALTAGETKNMPIVVGGYADLADISPLVSTLAIRPASGEVTRIVRQQQVEITDGSSLAVSVQSQQLTRGTHNGQVKFSLENTSAVAIDIVIATAGGTAASNEVQFMLLDEDGNVLSTQAFQQTLGEHVIALANGQTVARIPAGGHFESVWIDMPVPASAPSDVKLQLTIDKIHYHLSQADAVSIAGTTSRQPVTLIETSYYGEITQITPATSYGDEPIVITGNAIERATSNAIQLVPLQLVINLQGFERSYQVYTDQNGAFSHTFTPLATESGSYQVSAIHPDLTERPEQGQFVIQRISLGGKSDYTVNLRIPVNYEQRLDVPVTATHAEEHNVHLVYEAVDQPLGELPAGVQVNLGNALSVLNAGEPAQLSFTVNADDTAESTGTLVLKVKSDERGDTPIGRVIVNYQLSSAQPALFPSPSIIETGVTLDNSVTETITLENQGLADLTGLTVALLNEDGTPAPAWIYLTTPENLGTLAVGEKRDVQIMAYPSGSVSEGNYLFVLRASGDNHAPIDTYVAIAVSQSGVGHILFKVADIYTATLDDKGNVIEGLAGATIHLQNEKVLTVDETLTTDNAGEALFSDFPAGRYKFKATADNHQEVIGRFRIKPGITVSERVFLDYNLVTVEWSVTEITIEDRYEITLEATYETNVPAPVVILEPLSVNLPDMQPGEVYYGEFTLTNYGFIRADDLTFEVPTDQYFKYELLGHLPVSLGAKERVTIPYRVTALKALDQGTDGSGAGCEAYFDKIKITYTYICEDGEFRENSRLLHIFRLGCPPSDTNIDAGGLFPFPKPIEPSHVTCFGSRCGGDTRLDRFVDYLVKPGPGYKIIDGLKCWPVAERREYCGRESLPERLKNIAKEIVEPVGCSVNKVLMEFNDDATDLRVKVPGGIIKIDRFFYGNAWHWLYLSNKLQFNWNVLGNYIASIDKGGVTYKLFVDSPGTVWEMPANPVYVKDNAQIIKQADGYRWQNQTGQWKEYDLNGRMTAFGNRQGTLGKLLYPAAANASAIGIADRNDRQVFWFEYNPDGQLSAARDLDNRRVEYSYLGEHLTGVKDVLGQNTVYEYDGRGYFVKKIDSGNRITRVEYDSYGHPTAVTGANGDGFFFEYFYDASKKEYYSRMTTSSGKIKEVWYNKDGETKRVDINGRTVKMLEKDRRDLLFTDEKGNVIRKSYDEWNNLIRVVYPDKSTASYAYEHRFNRLTRAVDRRGHVTTYLYDDYGNVVQKTEAVGTVAERVTTFTYDAQNQLLTITVNGDANTEVATTALSYDNQGNIASIRDPLGNTVEFLQYDNLGNPLVVKDARGFTWRYSYDRLGRLASQTDPLNQISAYEYDGANNNTAVVDVAQNRFEFFYNEHNQLFKAIDPFLNESRIIYNSDKLPVQLIDEAGKTGLAEYDNEARLIRTVDGAGNAIVPHYDETQASFVSSYQPTKIAYPTYTQQLYYDKLQRLVRTTAVLDTNTRYSESYTYDAANNITARLDQQGNTSYYEFDALNRLVKITDALNGITELSYDDRNNVTAVKDGNNGITRYEYDLNNNLVKHIRPLGEVTLYSYDATNNQTARLDAKGQKIAYSYDALDRLTQVDYYAATDHSTPVKTVRFSYDAIGNLLSYDDGTTSASYSYDALQRKLSETVNYGAFTLAHSYEYYANSLKKSFTGPDGVKRVYEYDDNNRLSAIDMPDVGRVTYNSYQWNSPAKITLPGGTQIEWAYDPLMRLQSQVSQDAAQNVITQAAYEHSPTDNVTKKTTEAGEYTYQYDAVSRLTNATHPVLDDESYRYDSVGNRLTAAGVSAGASYNANNALIHYGESAFEHDANGNLIKQTLGTEVRHYVYDIEDRLVRVEEGSGTVIAEYTYDPFGRRLWKKVDGVKTYFGYADEGLIGEYDENGVETKAYGYRPGSLWTTNPLFQKTGGGYYWYQNDHIGTPQKLLDNAGNVVWAANYEIFGDAQVDIALIENNLRFPGQYDDVETGLYYNWHRYYDPISGRYLSLDPDREGHNLYAYVFNNPVRFVDPEGLHTVKEIDSILRSEPAEKLSEAWSEAYEDYKRGAYDGAGTVVGGIVFAVDVFGITARELGSAGLNVVDPSTYTKAISRGIIDTKFADDPVKREQLKEDSDATNDFVGALWSIKDLPANLGKAQKYSGRMLHSGQYAIKHGRKYTGMKLLLKSAYLSGKPVLDVGGVIGKTNALRQHQYSTGSSSYASGCN